MTQEEKARAYDEALERANVKIETYNHLGNASVVESICEIFPELKESEDRIRKVIFKALSKKDARDVLLANGIQVSDALSWLEKQGEYANFRNKIQIGDEVTRNEDGILVNLSQFKRMVKQKPTKKIQPKFKVGDWVVYKGDICQIVKREEGCNKLVTNFGIEKELVNERNLSTARLWSIQDAKDGDVLVASDGSIFIFKEVVDCGCKHYIAFVKDNERINVNDNLEHFWETAKGVNPSTEEQRDLLFSKMKEAGYEWSDKDRKLIKIVK